MHLSLLFFWRALFPSELVDFFSILKKMCDVSSDGDMHFHQYAKIFIYSKNLDNKIRESNCFQSKYRKIRTRNNSVFGRIFHFTQWKIYMVHFDNNMLNMAASFVRKTILPFGKNKNCF